MRGVRAIRSLGLSALLLVASSAGASVIVWDQSAVTAVGTTAYVYSNAAGGQNFSEPVEFESTVHVTGLDIYTMFIPGGISGEDVYGPVGAPVVIRLRSGNPSGPLQEFRSSISVRDFDGAPPGPVPGSSPVGVTVRVYADFPVPVALRAGYHWLGMSYASDAPLPNIPDLGMATMLGGVGPLLDGTLSQYDVTTLVSLDNPPIGDGQFRVWGYFASVPEPGSLALLGLGLAGLSLSRRRKAA